MATAMTSDVLSGLGLKSVQESQAKTNKTNELNSGHFMELLIAQIQNQADLDEKKWRKQFIKVVEAPSFPHGLRIATESQPCKQRANGNGKTQNA